MFKLKTKKFIIKRFFSLKNNKFKHIKNLKKIIILNKKNNKIKINNNKMLFYLT